MTTPRRASIGILPAGALGVSFFHHLTQGSRSCEGGVVFLTRRDSVRARSEPAGPLLIEAEGAVRPVGGAGLHAGDLVTCAPLDVVLVATNPDQLFGVLGDYVARCEREHAAAEAAGRGGLGAVLEHLPVLVLAANGIYFQRVRRTFTELLEEAELLGRLPALWPELMPRLVGRLLRGVTLQTGLRRGSGAEAVYRPGLRNRTSIAGGDPAVRARAVAALQAHGGLFDDAGETPPTRVEFEKALINLTANVLGQLDTVDAEGRFRTLTVDEIWAPAHHARIRELVGAVLRVGQAVRVYPPGESVDALFSRMLAVNSRVSGHVPSSIQWVQTELAAGRLAAALSPTDAWLLHPLRQYARTLGAADLVSYFDDLEQRVVDGLRRAAAYRARQQEAAEPPRAASLPGP